ncbi:MAG: diaminopimelate decarboxylase [Candidatus Neomarinimicrobiota bacterium]
MQICGLDVKELAGNFGTPLYVYDFERIRANANRLKNAFQSSEITTGFYYAMKANSHPAIVRLLSECGFGSDCVSPGELEIALKTGILPEHILYTGNYESREDLAAALSAGVTINLDDINSLERLLRLGRPELISYRINPGKGRGKFEQINTGGDRAKFGIPHEKAWIAYDKARQAGIKRFGAHMMTGSGVLDKDHFPRMLELLLDILGGISHKLGITFEFIDMGGGLGIPYFKDGHELDIQHVGAECLKIFKSKMNSLSLGNPALHLEPGRYLVGDAGYLLTSVLGIKESYQTFAGLDAGFNTLIRSALYKAQHPIIVDGKEDEKKLFPINLCGQICENTDIFTIGRPLPKLTEGDLLVFTQAGAYGNVMAMPYNQRLRPAEVAIIDGKAIEITRREVMGDYWSRIKFPALS